MKNYLLLMVLILALPHCGNAVETKGTGLSFIRQSEPNEGAFSILVPQGWQNTGGIFRVNPVQAGGPLNALGAKCDLTFQNDNQGTVSFRILPDIVYGHSGIGGGFFPPGSNYQGAIVRNLENAATHLQALFTTLRPGASGIKIMKLQRLPGEIQSLDQGMAYTNQLFMQIGGQSMTVRHDAAGGVFEYIDSGVHYREVLLTGIVDIPAALTWNNTRTLAFRAPAAEFKRWRPVMDIMRFSIRFNPQWILKESQGQQERAETVQKVYEEIRRLDQEIVRRTTVNREEILNDNFLVMTEQEEYVNPHSGEINLDTDAFRYRWVTPGNDVYYTDREDEDPNIFLQRTDYKRTPVRTRRN